MLLAATIYLLKLKYIFEEWVRQKKRAIDITWEHCEDQGNRLHVKCKYCSHNCWGGITRMKHHLAGTKLNVIACPSVLDDVKQIFVKLLESKEKKKEKDNLDCLQELQKEKEGPS